MDLLYVERFRDALANIQQFKAPDWLSDVEEEDDVLEETAPPWLQAVVFALYQTKVESERIPDDLKSDYLDASIESFEAIVDLTASMLWMFVHGFNAPAIKVRKDWKLVCAS